MEYNGIIHNIFEDGIYRIYTSDCKEIKVVIDDYGFYHTAVITNDNVQIIVEI